jgi:hypothetical protein
VSWNDFVGHIDDTCGQEKDFILLLKQERKEEAIGRIKAAMTVDRQIGNIMLQGTLRGVEATFFCNGKLILKGLGSRENLERYLEELFPPA